MLTNEHIQGTCSLTTFQHINNSCIPQENLHSFKLPVNTAQLVTNWSKQTTVHKVIIEESFEDITAEYLVSFEVSWSQITCEPRQPAESSSSQEEDKTTLQIVTRWIKDQLSCGFHHSHNLCVARAHLRTPTFLCKLLFPVQYSSAHHCSPPIHSLP